MRFKAHVALASLITLIIAGQIAESQTVGNGTVFAPSGVVIAPSAGQREFSGANSSTNTAVGSTGSGDFATRHYSRGESSGIGGSFIGTASPTSESSPAIIVNPTAGANIQQFRLPTLQSSFGSTSSTPALETFSPALPQTPRLQTLASPFDSMSFSRDARNMELDELPSFNSQSSFMEKAQFNEFGKR